MAQGDLLFYYQHPTVWDRLIVWYTGSRFYHIAIDDGTGYKIEALSNGIKRNKIVEDGSFVRWSYAAHSTVQDPLRMAGALKDLHAMIDQEYGWWDVVTAANPLRKWLYVVSPAHYDCATLAAQCLLEAGGVDLGEVRLDVHLVTPGSFAKILGVK